MTMETVDTDPTDEEIAFEPLLQLFKHSHLKEGPMRETSLQFCHLARKVVANLPRNPERTVCLRKLREAKDAAITALLWK
jgi:hypothetical protein